MPASCVEIDPLGRFGCDDDALGPHLEEFGRRVVVERVEVEILDRNPLDLDRLGLAARGLVRGRRQHHAFEDETVVAERLGAFVGERSGRRLFHRLLETAEAIGGGRLSQNAADEAQGHMIRPHTRLIDIKLPDAIRHFRIRDTRPRVPG